MQSRLKVDDAVRDSLLLQHQPGRVARVRHRQGIEPGGHGGPVCLPLFGQAAEERFQERVDDPDDDGGRNGPPETIDLEVATIQSVRYSISRSIKKSAMPRVTMMTGSASTVRIGLTKMFTMLNTSPATTSAQALSP